MESKQLFNGEIIVQRFYMLPTPKDGQPKQWVYSAWQRLDNPFTGRHHTITTFDGVWYGKIGTDPEPEKYDHLPVGQTRFDAVRNAYRYRALIAEQYIHDAYDETKGLTAGEYGEIEVTR